MTNDLVAQQSSLPELADAGISALPLSLRLIADESTYARVWSVANAMAKSPGLVPPHLIGKAEACFTVVVASLEWRQNPMMVARCTYQTPGGGVGFLGKLVRSIAEASGHLAKPIGYEFYGPWEQVQGKFQMVESQKTDSDGNRKKYARATYTTKDEEGIGVMVSFFLKDEAEPRTFRFDLRQAYPRNSVMWATDPKTQIIYTATRRAVDAVAPHLLLGMPFEDEFSPSIGPDRARDVTPPSAPDPLLAQIGTETPAAGLGPQAAGAGSDVRINGPHDQAGNSQKGVETNGAVRAEGASAVKETVSTAHNQNAGAPTPPAAGPGAASPTLPQSEQHPAGTPTWDAAARRKSPTCKFGVLNLNGEWRFLDAIGTWCQVLCELGDAASVAEAALLWKENLKVHTDLSNDFKGATDQGHLQAVQDHFVALHDAARQVDLLNGA